MIKETLKHDEFIFRKDNREKIKRSDVEHLKESIQRNNMLHLNPILVNEKMEIMDGQHRTMAAQELGLPVFYIIAEGLEAKDIIDLNVSKRWSHMDYLNFYCQHENEQYIKLREFMDKRNISISVALNLMLGRTVGMYSDFKRGKLVFPEEFQGQLVEVCWKTIDIIKKFHGAKAWYRSAKLWNAMIQVFKMDDFDIEKWLKNSSLLSNKFHACIDTNSYYDMIVDIYNWRNHKKITTEYDQVREL